MAYGLRQPVADPAPQGCDDVRRLAAPRLAAPPCVDFNRSPIRPRRPVPLTAAFPSLLSAQSGGWPTAPLVLKLPEQYLSRNQPGALRPAPEQERRRWRPASLLLATAVAVG